MIVDEIDGQNNLWNRRDSFFWKEGGEKDENSKVETWKNGSGTIRTGGIDVMKKKKRKKGMEEAANVASEKLPTIGHRPSSSATLWLMNETWA